MAVVAVALGCQRLAGLPVELAVVAVALGAKRLAGLAVVAVALGCQRLAGLAVMAMALGARSLVVVVVWARSLAVNAFANVGRNHSHCLTPLLLQLRQRLDARLLKSPSMKRYLTCTYTTYTSPSPPHQDVLQLCQRRCPWLDQLCGCLSRQQLRQRLEHLFCCWLGRCV